METEQMTDPDIAAIARRLTKAQRSYLTDKAEWRKPVVWAQPRWMTFPPANTHRVLNDLGLVDRSGQITPLGLRLRQYLQETARDPA